MAEEIAGPANRRLSVLCSAAIIAYTFCSGMCVLWKTVVNPRTDDAEIFANFIGIAPVVNGPITKLHIADNQLIKEGDTLFEIDDRPYRYALAQAKSDSESLNGQIENQRRTIASLNSGVDVAKSAAMNSEAGLNRASASVEQAKADVSNAKAAVDKADSELAYARNNLARLEPLLARQFVTIDQVDKVKTTVTRVKKKQSNRDISEE